MNNQELEQKIKEILSISNFFDMIESAVSFEKEYKNTDFYKKTKMSLFDIIKMSKVWYSFNIKELSSKVQSMIDSLNFAQVQSIIEQFGNVFSEENEEVANQLKQINEMDFDFLKNRIIRSYKQVEL